MLYYAVCIFGAMSVFKLRFLIVSEIGAPRVSEGFYMGSRRDLYRLLKGFYECSKMQGP